SGARPGRTGTVKRDKQILIRLTDEEFAAIQAAADAADSAIANWARAVLLAAARQRQSQPTLVGRVEIHRTGQSASSAEDTAEYTTPIPTPESVFCVRNSP
ncbi:MAG: hypothetical protein M0Z36_00465, partial [Thermaerobacter sp.]|nr:hypothetical protein [Thermaerobacter sp.]